MTTHTIPTTDITVTIQTNDKGNPVGKLADTELAFRSGPLAGLKLIGFAVWERASRSGRTVSFPARQYSVSGERRSFALLRPVAEPAAQDAVRSPIGATRRRRSTARSDHRRAVARDITASTRPHPGGRSARTRGLRPPTIAQHRPSGQPQHHSRQLCRAGANAVRALRAHGPCRSICPQDASPNVSTARHAESSHREGARSCRPRRYCRTQTGGAGGRVAPATDIERPTTLLGGNTSRSGRVVPALSQFGFHLVQLCLQLPEKVPAT